jgi:hypothetical protein
MTKTPTSPQNAASDNAHIESQPIPGHNENIPTNPANDPKRGPTEDRAPDATPDTKPGTPPGTQSESDRLKTPEAGNPL